MTNARVGRRCLIRAFFPSRDIFRVRQRKMRRLSLSNFPGVWHPVSPSAAQGPLPASLPLAPAAQAQACAVRLLGQSPVGTETSPVPLPWRSRSSGSLFLSWVSGSPLWTRVSCWTGTPGSVLMCQLVTIGCGHPGRLAVHMERPFRDGRSRLQPRSWRVLGRMVAGARGPVQRVRVQGWL